MVLAFRAGGISINNCEISQRLLWQQELAYAAVSHLCVANARIWNGAHKTGPRVVETRMRLSVASCGRLQKQPVLGGAYAALSSSTQAQTKPLTL